MSHFRVFMLESLRRVDGAMGAKTMQTICVLIFEALRQETRQAQVMEMMIVIKEGNASGTPEARLLINNIKVR